MSDKTKYPLAVAKDTAEYLVKCMSHFSVRIEIAGSIRCQKSEVGDIELCYISKLTPQASGDLFGGAGAPVNEVNHYLETMLTVGLIRKRINERGSTMWGLKNRFGVHVSSGLPVDFFETTEENWFNYLVCRTGPMENNLRIATAANRMGWQWNPYGSGFTRLGPDGNPTSEHSPRMASERAVYEFVGLKYLEPEER